MFGLMVGTLIYSDKAQSKYAWSPNSVHKWSKGLGLGFIKLLPKVMARSFQGHSKVTAESNQYKSVE